MGLSSSHLIRPLFGANGDLTVYFILFIQIFCIYFKAPVTEVLEDEAIKLDTSIRLPTSFRFDKNASSPKSPIEL